LKVIKGREDKARRSQAQKERNKSEWGRPKEKVEGQKKGEKHKGEGKTEWREIILGFYSCTAYAFHFTSVHFADWWERKNRVEYKTGSRDFTSRAE
jgi:hypothetical protein